MVLHAACRTVRGDDRSAGMPKTFCCFKHIIPKGKHRAQAPVIKYYIEHMYSAARRVPLCSNPSLQKTSEHTRMLQLACRTASFIHMKIKAQLWSGKILNTTNPVNQCKISRCTRRRKVLMRCKYPNFCVHVRTVKKALSKTCHWRKNWNNSVLSLSKYCFNTFCLHGPDIYSLISPEKQYSLKYLHKNVYAITSYIVKYSKYHTLMLP